MKSFEKIYRLRESDYDEMAMAANGGNLPPENPSENDEGFGRNISDFDYNPAAYGGEDNQADLDEFAAENIPDGVDPEEYMEDEGTFGDDDIDEEDNFDDMDDDFDDEEDDGENPYDYDKFPEDYSDFEDQKYNDSDDDLDDDFNEDYSEDDFDTEDYEDEDEPDWDDGPGMSDDFNFDEEEYFE